MGRRRGVAGYFGCLRWLSFMASGLGGDRSRALACLRTGEFAPGRDCRLHPRGSRSASLRTARRFRPEVRFRRLAAGIGSPPAAPAGQPGAATCSSSSATKNLPQAGAGMSPGRLCRFRAQRVTDGCVGLRVIGKQWCPGREFLRSRCSVSRERAAGGRHQYPRLWR